MTYHDISSHLLFPPIPILYPFPSQSHSHSSPHLIRHPVLTLIPEIPEVIPTLSPQFRCTYSPGYRALYPRLSSHLPCNMSCSSSCLCPLSLPTPFSPCPSTSSCSLTHSYSLAPSSCPPPLRLTFSILFRPHSHSLNHLTITSYLTLSLSCLCPHVIIFSHSTFISSSQSDYRITVLFTSILTRS